MTQTRVANSTQHEHVVCTGDSKLRPQEFRIIFAFPDASEEGRLKVTLGEEMPGLITALATSGFALLAVATVAGMGFANSRRSRATGLPSKEDRAARCEIEAQIDRGRGGLL